MSYIEVHFALRVGSSFKQLKWSLTAMASSSPVSQREEIVERKVPYCAFHQRYLLIVQLLLMEV